MSRPVFPPVPFFAALAVLATCTAVSLFVRMAEYGSVTNWDSMAYVSVATSLLNGNGFVTANGARLELWPPLYSMLLAAASALASVHPLHVVGPLNAALFGLCVFAAGSWMRRSLDSRFLIVIGCLAVALSPSLNHAAVLAFSETAFVLFATLALTGMDRHLANGGRRSLVWAAVFTGLAWATRYIGVVVAIAAVVALALRRGVPLSARAKGIAVYSLISAAPVCIWVLLIGSIAPSGRELDYPLPKVLEKIAGATGALLLDISPRLLKMDTNWPVLHTALGGLSLFALAAALVTGVAPTRKASRDDGSSFRLFGGFVIFYVCFYAWASMAGQNYHGVGLRHVLPMYIPLLFAALLAADRLLRRGREGQAGPAAPMARGTGLARTGGLALAAALSFQVLWIAPAHLRGALTGEGTHDGHGFGYRDSGVMRWLRDNPSDADLYSNAPDVAWLYGAPRGGLYRPLPMNRSPFSLEHSSGDSAPRDVLGLFLKRAWHGDRVVWIFDNGTGYRYDYDATDMRARTDLRLVADLADGAVFEVNKTLGGEADDPLSAALAAAPTARAVFDVRIHENRLIYSRNPCVRADTRARFFLHVFPADGNDLPDDRKRHGFAGLDFDFELLGMSADGTCATAVALPEWRIARVVTGQFAGDDHHWETELRFDGAGTARAPAPGPATEE